MTFRAGFYETNSACRAMFGWTDEMEFPAAAPKEWVVPRDQAAVAGKLIPVLRGASDRASFEATALRSDGSEFPLLVEAARIELDDGPVIVTFLADLSEARRDQGIHA
jgi:PAS domain S-box-containing protein